MFSVLPKKSSQPPLAKSVYAGSLRTRVGIQDSKSINIKFSDICDVIREKVPKVGNVYFELMIVFDRRMF